MRQRRTTRRRTAARGISALLLASILASGAQAAPGPWQRTETRQPCANFDLFRQPYFGDTHVHTAYSSDAVFAGTRENPRGAYRFAQGAAHRPAAVRRAGSTNPHRATAPPARLHRGHRSRGAVRRDQHLPDPGPARLRLRRLRLPPALSSPRRRRRCRRFSRRSRSSVPARLRRSVTPPQRFAWCGPDGADCLARGLAGLAGHAGGGRGVLRPHLGVHASRPSSPTSGAASRAGTTCTATSSSATPSCPALPTATWSSRRRRACGTTLEAQCLDGLPGCDVLAIPHNPNASGGLHVRARQRRRQPAHRRRRRVPRIDGAAGGDEPAQGRLGMPSRRRQHDRRAVRLREAQPPAALHRRSRTRTRRSRRSTTFATCPERRPRCRSSSSASTRSSSG